jgi:hypothetical protein
LNELHDACGGDERARRQALERLAVAQETVFEVQALRFERAEELFDDPAAAIELDDPRRLGERGRLMRGQQTPDDRLFGRRRVDLARLDEKERDLRRIAPVGPVRSAAERFDLVHRHSWVAEKAREPDLLRPSVGQLAHACAEPRAHALQRLPPLFSSRRSSKNPTSKSAIADPFRIKVGRYRITPDSRCASDTSLREKA